MISRSIYKQIIDEFAENLSKEKSIKQPLIDSLKELLVSEDFKKEEIERILKKESQE